MDVIPILEIMSQFGMIRLNKIINNYYSIYCPIHNNGNEKKASFGVLLHDEVRNKVVYKTGWCHCFTCGYAEPLTQLITDILKSQSISQSGIDWLKQNVPGFEAEDVSEFEAMIPEEVMESLNAQYAINQLLLLTGAQQQTYVPESELATYRFTVPYMYERKLIDSVIERFDVGFDANFVPNGRVNPVPCLTFPVKDEEGRTLFIYRRAVDSKFFTMPTGLTKPVYGLDQITDTTVCVCESIINCLTLWSWGYQAVALMGTGNAYQTQQLKQSGITDYILCFDGDEAGESATRKYKRLLKDVAMVWSVKVPTGKDVNDLTKEEFDTLYESRD